MREGASRSLLDARAGDAPSTGALRSGAMNRRNRWGCLLAAALGSVGCQGEETGLGDAGATEDRREICFPSCRLGEVCTPDNRCVTPTNPFRDAGFARDRGAD